MSRAALAWRGLLLVALVVVAVLITIHVGLPSQAQLRHTFGEAGWWAPIGYAGLYALATLSPLPKTVFTLAAGVVFGVAVGLPTVLVGATVGAIAAYGLARILGRDTVDRLAGRRLAQLDVLIERRGFLTVLVARLIPVIPFTTINYLAGLTRIRLRSFTLATVVGILPATAAYVTLGAYDTHPGAWPFWAALGTLAVLTVAGGVAAWHRRRIQAERLPGPDAQEQSASRRS